MDTNFLFSTNYLFAVVSSLIQVPTFFLDKFFPNMVISPTEDIHFDVQFKTRRLAPFVSPNAPGKLMNEQGYATKTLRPAYVKPKTVFNPNSAIKRSAGEQIGGNLSPLQRYQTRINNVLMDQVDTIMRRMEWMAVQGLVNGSITISGDQYPETEVDFGRKSQHSIALTGGNLWDANTPPNILAQLMDWKLMILQATGANALDVVMDVDAWKKFIENTYVKERFVRFQGSSQTTLQSGQPLGEGGTFMGTIDGFNIWVYAAWYIDDDGTEQPMLDSGRVILTGPQLAGTRAFGAILDEAAWSPEIAGATQPGLISVPIFPKSWIENDPPQRQIMCQSAPLVVPTRVNASVSAKVLPES